jgi:hypothetical protein
MISAADCHETLFRLLDDNYTTHKLKELFEKQPVYTSFIQISLGIKRELKEMPYVLRVKTQNPFILAGEERQELCLVHYDFDKSLSGQGKNSLIILFTTSISWWEQINYRSDKYISEKERILETTIEQLENILPGISSQIEVSDVATPYTTIRYTNNYKSALGFIPTADYIKELRKPQYKLDTLFNFYMSGQWISGMGVPNAALSGKNVIKEICKSEGIKWL